MSKCTGYNAVKNHSSLQQQLQIGYFFDNIALHYVWLPPWLTALTQAPSWV